MNANALVAAWLPFSRCAKLYFIRQIDSKNVILRNFFPSDASGQGNILNESIQLMRAVTAYQLLRAVRPRQPGEQVASFGANARYLQRGRSFPRDRSGAR